MSIMSEEGKKKWRGPQLAVTGYLGEPVTTTSESSRQWREHFSPRLVVVEIS